MITSGVDATLESDAYDEFAFLGAHAAEWNLPLREPYQVERRSIEVAPGQSLSAIVWGKTPAQLVFLHGGGQNAHTWDTVLVALNRPAVAIDLPGHGHSSWREDRDYSPWTNAATLAQVLPTLAPSAEALVGMSLGGATTIRLAAERPDLVKRAVVVDVTPQVNDPARAMTRAERGSVALIAGPPTYDTFEEMAAAAVALNPQRSAESVRRGVRHNARRMPDGKWRWRYDLFSDRGSRSGSDFTRLWDDVSRITAPTMLLRGGASKYVLDADVAEMRRRLPALRVEDVAGAGHAIQSDQPLEMAKLIEDFVFNRQ